MIIMNEVVLEIFPLIDINCTSFPKVPPHWTRPLLVFPAEAAELPTQGPELKRKGFRSRISPPSREDLSTIAPPDYQVKILF